MTPNLMKLANHIRRRSGRELNNFHHLFYFCPFQCVQVRPVSANLEPGTSMNVTLRGNYTKMEGPYKAKLKSYYADTTETRTRDIEGTVSEI